MAMTMFEQDAKRLFASHSPLIRRCIERFSTFARDDGNGRVALGFMPLSPEKYAKLSQIYQCVHHLMVCFYHLDRTEATLEDWINLLQFDPIVIRSNQGWVPGARLDESDEAMRAGFEKLAIDVLAFRQKHLKDILCQARQEAEHAATHGQREAHELFQSVADQFFLRQRREGKDEATDGDTVAPARGLDISEQIRMPLSFLSGLLSRNAA